MNTNAPDSKTGPVPIEVQIDEMRAAVDRSGLADGRKTYDVLVRFDEFTDDEARFAELLERLTGVADAVSDGSEHRRGLDEQVAYDLLVGLPVIGFKPFKTEDGNVYYEATVDQEGEHLSFVAGIRLPQDHSEGAIEVVPSLSRVGRSIIHGGSGTDFPEDMLGYR